MSLVHRGARAESVVTRVPLWGLRVRRDWRLETLPERERMRNAWSFRRSKREAEADGRLSGETTAMPPNDELVRGRIGASGNLDDGRFYLGDAVERGPGCRPAQDLFQPVHLGAVAAFTTERHERVSERD